MSIIKDEPKNFVFMNENSNNANECSKSGQQCVT